MKTHVGKIARTLGCLLCATTYCLLAQDGVSYNFVAGRRLTNETISVWFLPCATGCKVVTSEDCGNKTKMVEYSYEETCATTKIPRSFLQELAAISTNREARGIVATGINADYTVHIDRSVYYCALNAQDIEHGIGKSVHAFFCAQYKAMLMNSNKSVRVWTLDKSNVTACAVDIADVLAAPHKYIGKRVRITGYLWRYDESASLFGSPPKLSDTFPQFPYDRSIWVGYRINDHANAFFKKWDGAVVRVCVEGLLYAEVSDGVTRAGNMNLWPLEIAEITEVTLQGDEERKERNRGPLGINERNRGRDKRTNIR